MFYQKWFFLTIITLSMVATLFGQNITEKDNDLFKKSSREEIKLLKKVLGDLIEEHSDQFSSFFQSNQTNSSNECVESFKKMNKGMLTTVLDSTFKPVAGILEGGVKWLGNYRECMKQDGLHFCVIGEVAINGTFPLTLGLCVPDECTLEDVLFLLNKISNMTTFGNTAIFKILNNGGAGGIAAGGNQKDKICYSKDPLEYSNGAIIMLVITGLILALCFLGTITELVDNKVKDNDRKYKMMDNEDEKLYDNPETVIKKVDSSDGLKEEKNVVDVSMHNVTISQKKSPMLNFLLCFSVLKNTRAIMDTNVPKGSITALNGMRTLSITWVVLGHCLVFSLQFIDDSAVILSWLPRFSMQAIVNASVSVDSFFFLSGLLVAYLSMKRFDAKGKLPLVRYYVHRYFRLTPSYAYLLFFFAYLFPIMGSGPYWFALGRDSPQSENCISYWWTNLLYINNLYPEVNDGCFGWSWYLANDMQFYVISPIILYIMYKFRWIGLVLSNGFLLVVCFLCNALLIYYYQAYPIFNSTGLLTDKATMKHVTDYQAKIYFKPYTRISPYIVGLILGYIMNKKYKIKEQYSQMFYTIGWLCAIGLGIAVVYGPYSVHNYTWGMADYVTYGTFFRFVWAVAIGWVLYACHNGKGGIVDSILSWKAFIPLSRLTYAVYLLHPMVLFYYFGVTNIPTDFTVTFYIYYFIACTFISFMLAFVIAVCIEYPIFNLEKLVTKLVTE